MSWQMSRSERLCTAPSQHRDRPFSSVLRAGAKIKARTLPNQMLTETGAGGLPELGGCRVVLLAASRVTAAHPAQ